MKPDDFMRLRPLEKRTKAPQTGFFLMDLISKMPFKQVSQKIKNHQNAYIFKK